MPLMVELKPGPYALSGTWLTKEDFAEIGEDSTIELFGEDTPSLLADLAATEAEHPDDWPDILKAIIARVYWQDDDKEGK